MNPSSSLDALLQACSRSVPEPSDEKFIGWDDLLTVLINQGLRLCLPELKSWVLIGATALSLKRQEIQKRLIKYAKEKELDFPMAEKAAGVIAEQINEENLKTIADELEAAS